MEAELIVDLILFLGIPLAMILLGLICGRIADHRHFRRLEQKERELSGMLVSDLRRLPVSTVPEGHGELVTGEVVIANDYLKSFLASLRKIIGGEMKSYRILVERARREALVRLMERARDKGYNAVWNVRLETMDVGGMTKSNGAAMVCLMAYGTAFKVASPS